MLCHVLLVTLHTVCLQPAAATESEPAASEQAESRPAAAERPNAVLIDPANPEAIAKPLDVLIIGSGTERDGDRENAASSDDDSVTNGKSIAGWAVVELGGQGVVELLPGEPTGDASSDGGPILRIGSGSSMTAVKWTGPIDPKPTAASQPPSQASSQAPSQPASSPAAANTAAPPLPTLPRANYRLRWQARRVLGGDFFCTVLFPVQADACSVVVGGWGGGVVGLSSLNGFDASENETTTYYRFEDDRWYDFALTVTDDRIAFTIDGELQFEVDPREHAIGTRVEMLPARPLGLATWDTTGDIRQLTLQRLPPLTDATATD